MTDKILEERIQRLEHEIAAIRRATAGLTVGAGLNRLGQRTVIDGDLDLHEHKVVNGKIDPVDNLTSIGEAAGRYPAADGLGGVVWQDSIQPSSYFLHSEDADVAGYKTIDDAPTDDPATFDQVVITNASGTVIIQEFITAPGGLGTTLLAGGVYDFHFWSEVSSTAGNTILSAVLYKRALAGAETQIALATAIDFTGTSVVEIVFSVAVGDIVLLPTDRLVLKARAVTDSAAAITVKLHYEGTANPSHFHTPGMAGSPADHGGLIGLGDDDHVQYLLASGSRAATELRLQEQTSIPTGTADINKLVNYKNNLLIVDEGGGYGEILRGDGWTPRTETFSYYGAVTNLIFNPSFEVDLFGWSFFGAGSSITRVAGGVWGGFCLRAVMAAAGSGHFVSTSPSLVDGAQHRVGFYARSISGNTALHCELNGGIGGANFTLTAAWQWFSLLPTANAFDFVYFWLGGAGTFELDGVHAIQTTDDPPYTDPGFPNCGSWAGVAHASQSTRTNPILAVSGNYYSANNDPFETGVKFLAFQGSWKYLYSITRTFDSARNITWFMPYGGNSYALTGVPTVFAASRLNHPKNFPHWLTYAVTARSSVGTITAYTAALSRFCIIAKVLFIEVVITITNNGTGAGVVFISLPALPYTYWNGTGREGNITGKQLQMVNSGFEGAVFNYDNTYPGGTNYQLILSANYEMF